MDKVVKHVLPGFWTREGAGVKVYRVFGSPELAELTDPFLLLDHFGSRYPHEYLMGFPWHPHRGIVTVTYLLKGQVEHGDSEGNRGVLGPGDVQWMTAGSGIFHEEMPRPGRVRQGDRELEDPEVSGFQLWVNLPRAKKMADPMYRNAKASHVPVAELDGGSRAVVIAGRVRAHDGPVEGVLQGLEVPVVYMDLRLPEESSFSLEVREGWRALAYVVEGTARMGGRAMGARELAILSREGRRIVVVTGGRGARLLLAAGQPLEEPIAWYGPIVMNSWEEIEEAFRELREGTFIKRRAAVSDY